MTEKDRDEFRKEFIDKLRSKIPKNLNSKWDFGNGILYDMCRNYNLHEEVDKVIAKIWLIGRSYAAAIERMKGRKENKENIDDFYIKKVAPRIIDSDLDSKLADLNQDKDIAENNIMKILELHKYLCVELEEITHQTNRSFSSKYLHFHKPELFYIYDSGVSKVLREFPKNQNEVLKFKTIIESNKIDTQYAKFFIKCFCLTSEIKKELDKKISPRQLDNLLIANNTPDDLSS